MRKKSTPLPSPTPHTTSDTLAGYWWVLGASLLVILVTRLRLLGLPLERDEGGFAYIGRHLFSEKRLYTDLLDIKLPGLYFLYWLFDWLPGSGPIPIHLGYLLWHAATLFLFFKLVRHLFDDSVAAVATSLFALTAILPEVFGFAAHATQLLLLPLMGGLWLLWQFCHISSKNTWFQLILSGFLLGLAVTIKQPAGLFVAFGCGVLLLHEGAWGLRLARTIGFGLASLVPIASVVGYFWSQGRLADFWNWNYVVPMAQAIEAEESATYLRLLLPRVVGQHGLFWGLGLVSLAVIPLAYFPKSSRIWAVGLLLFALPTSVVGLGFMPHYFVPLIPWVALGVAVLLHVVAQRFFKKNKTVYTALAATLVGITVLSHSAYFFKADHQRIMDEAYHWNGFPELEAIALELNRRLKPGETVGILGSEPQVNYYTDTEHCSAQLYMYPLIRPHAQSLAFQQQFLRELATCNPAYLVVTTSEASWMPGFAETDFFKKQLFPLATSQYELIGRANIGQSPMSIVWGDALKTHQPPKCPPIFIFKKK
jgi:Dolichyl-phosphate-mannose-protein mannosyltransferase